MPLLFRQLFDRESCTYTYLVADTEARLALLVDSVREQVERDLTLLKQLGLPLRYCLETHVHADHVTGAARLRDATGCQTLVPKGAEVGCADGYLGAGDLLSLGKIAVEAIGTPGHTDSHLAYWVNGDRVLTGDALFVRGCGRTDFQGGDAGALYDSVTQGLFTLPETTRVYPGHDYRGQTVSTIGEEKRWNPRFVGRDRTQFIEFMGQLNLPTPQKMMEAVPANQRCGDATAPAP